MFNEKYATLLLHCLLMFLLMDSTSSFKRSFLSSLEHVKKIHIYCIDSKFKQIKTVYTERSWYDILNAHLLVRLEAYKMQLQPETQYIPALSTKWHWFKSDSLDTCTVVFWVTTQCHCLPIPQKNILPSPSRQKRVCSCQKLVTTHQTTQWHSTTPVGIFTNITS